MFGFISKKNIKKVIELSFENFFKNCDVLDDNQYHELLGACYIIGSLCGYLGISSELIHERLTEFDAIRFHKKENK